jgi:hypothetical protein
VTGARGPAAAHLVGRARELAQLAAAVEDAMAGRGRLVLLTGEPGIGKTALARAVVEHARALGLGTAWGAGWDGGGAPAYWPWIQIVRGLAAQRELAGLRGELGSAATWIAGLLPELRAGLGDPPAPPDLDPDEARFRLFDALGVLLGAAAARAPLVVVMDDLHWADTASALALEFVARELPGLPVLVLATYREEDVRRRDDLAHALGGLARAGRRLPLGGLRPAELEQLIAQRAGAEDGAAAPPAALIARLHEVTGGNPFFADELIRLLEAQGRLGDPAAAQGELPLPVGVREAILRRLAAFPDATVQLLATAAVVGSHFRTATLADALQREPDAVLDAVDDPLRLGVLETADEPGRFVFTHALVRQTLLENLGPRRRASLHLAVGRAIERRHAADPDRRLDELAHHFVAAGLDGDVGQAVAYAERAGDRAFAVFAYAEAARLYAAALDAAQGLEPDDDRRGRLARRLGEARTRAGDVAGGRVALAQAADAARRLGDARRFAHAVLARTVHALSPGLVEDELVALLREAIERIDARRAAGAAPEDDDLRIRLGVQLAMALYWSPRSAERAVLADEAIALARALCERPDADAHLARRALAHALAQGHLAVWGPDTLERGLADSAEALGLCEREGDSELALQILSWRIHLLLEAPNLQAAYRAMDDFAALVARLGQPRALLHEPLNRAIRALLEGDFAGAKRLTGRGAQLAERVPGSPGELIAGAQTAYRLRWLGGLDAVVPRLRGLADALPAMPLWRHALAVALVEGGREAEARAEYERFAAGDFDDVPRDSAWLASMCLLAELAGPLGSARHARLLYDRLEPYAGRNAVASVVLGPVARHLGLLALALGDHERALAHLRDARQAMQRAAARPHLALLALDEARAHAARAGPGDAARAAELAAAARDRATALGMYGVAARAQAIADAGDGAPAGAGRGATAGTATGASARGATFHRDGGVWTIGYAGRVLRLADAKGLHYLAALVAAPGAEIPAAALEGRPAAEQERARVNVQRAIRAATRRIAQHDAELGGVLERAVRTGAICVYAPDALAPLVWDVRGAPDPATARSARRPGTK